MSKKTYIKLRVTQMLLGFAMLIVTAIILALASNGNTIIESDATPVLITAPLGLWLICSRHIIIHH